MGYYVLGFVLLVVGGVGLYCDTRFMALGATWQDAAINVTLNLILIVLGVFNIVMRRINKRQKQRRP